jgi:DNA repair exonuclease SbcCD ATPase subunit
MDHKTFTQVVYQSSAYSLEFLTATDSNRKKFLIDLLDLVRYTELCDKYKGISKDVSNLIEVVNMKQKTVDNWLTKFSKESIEEERRIRMFYSETEFKLCPLINIIYGVS